MKYPINVMCLNHHTPLPNARTHTHTHPHTLIVKKLSSVKPIPGAKRSGTTALHGSREKEIPPTPLN